jgi:hypothetical protein
LAALLLSWGVWAATTGAGEPTRADARRIHWAQRYSERSIDFSTERRALVASKYGEEYLPGEERVRYIHVPTWKWQRHADVFEVQGESAQGPYSLIVCVHQGRIAEIEPKTSTQESGPRIPGEFLGQFVGRGVNDSFEVATSAEEAFTLPARLRPIGGEPELSRTIARDLRKVLIWAEVARHPGT